jgi:uncharacterized protein VirK/YbjX
MLLTSLDIPGTPGPLAWPDARTMFADAFELGLERRTKYAWRLLLTRKVRAGLLRALAGNRPVEALFRGQPRAFYPLMNHLVDRRLGARARLQMTLASLQSVTGAMGDEAQLQQLLTGGLTLLALGDGTRVVLSLNDVSFHEGLWQVGLIGEDGVRLYSIGFGFADGDTLLIGNVQGPSLKDEGLDRIRDATHAAHGMRPPHLLVHVLRLLAARWGATQLRGVDPENHVKGRWNLRDSRLRFDYRGFWEEHDGLRGSDGNWALPLATAQRPIEEVPTKRRAMYRRRYAMLESLQEAVLHLGHAQSADPAPVPLVDAGTGHADQAANAATLEPVQAA